MRFRPIAALALSLALATSASAQGIMADFHADVNELQKKMLDLAKAIPEANYSWKPGAARTTAEVLVHVAADNYLIPVAMGKPAPAGSGITSDYNTAAAFEKKNATLNKAQIIAELEASFKHLHEAMSLTTDANLTEQINMFGRSWSRQRAMILTVTHLHEHLGQMIAYARANNVTPPWSQ